ncbi:MAG: hypothetical protein PHQ12_14755 [Chthoniobacteraceae bacterium]|nr:hypothetical protein [Chthoniobacteraceae bacterium]
MKKLPTLCLAALAALTAFAPLLPAQQPAAPPAPANPYDLLSRVLTPIATVFSPEAAPRALSLTLVLEGMTDLPPELAASRVELLVQPPDRALLRSTYDGHPVTLCRVGDSLWITPNTPPFAALANPPEMPGKKKKKGHPAGLAPIVLPFPPQQLVLLPILFQVKEGPQDQGMRTLDVKLMPELARGLGVEEWSTRITVGPGEKPARVRVLGPGWSLIARVERLEYADRLPAATWQAPEGALRLNARQVVQWSDFLGRQVDSHRP